MVFAELDRRVRKSRAQRTKLFVQMLTTFAFGSLGLAVAEPIIDFPEFGLGHLIALAFGLVCASAAVYLVPEGERYGAD
jgi:hypothetical protein